jgi:spore coat protein U-like protein
VRRSTVSAVLLLAALFVLPPTRAFAEPLCTISNATPLTFNGSDDDPRRPDDGRARFTITCPATLTTTISILYSHVMRGARASQLMYDLYADPQRSVLWGGGADGGIVRQAVAAGRPATVYIYARIRPHQRPFAGTFADSIDVVLTP